MKFKKPFFKAIFWLGFAGFSGTATLLGGLYLYLSPKLPAVETLRDVKFQTPLRVYSSDQKLIGEFGEKRRSPISYENIPEHYIKAILAAEDDQFYSHHGVSIKGLLRASSQLLLTGHIQSGGSTITMQVARNFFLTRHQTFARKFNEILLALQIEKELTKEEILELYVNVIFLGNRAYGIQAASRIYYGREINALNLAQLAMIAGLPKAPSAYNPIVNPSRALLRRNWILGRMKSLDLIDEATYQAAVAEPVTAKYHGLSVELNAPYVAEMARKEAVSLIGDSAYTDGYSVYTTIDSQLQAKAQQAVVEGLLTYDQRHGYRGPEQKLEAVFTQTSAERVGDMTDSAMALETISEQNGTAGTQLDLEPWQETLRSIPSYSGLEPAAVTRVEEKSIEALLGDGSLITLGWDQGLSSARAYQSESRVGAKPKQAADILEVGDVIRVVKKVIDNNEQWHLSQIPAAQAALVALNPENGAIRSLVGGFDFNQSHFNRATQAARQPGSNFKPFIYTAALEQGFTPATIINDAPIVFHDASLEGTWRPVNSGGEFNGPTRLRQALYQSRNLVSIRVLNNIGIPEAIRGMDRYGFDTSQLPRDLSLALGSYALTPLQVATGYAVFANGGYKVDPFLVEKVISVEGEIIHEAAPLTVCRKCADDTPEESTEDERPPAEEIDTDLAATAAASSLETAPDGVAATLQEEQRKLPQAPKVLDDQVAYIIDSMLRDVVQKGTGKRAKVLKRNDLAGKTGTTNGPRDAWFSGYTGHIVTTTWLGFDQNLLLGNNEFGGSAALPIWINFMRTALKGVPETVRQQPDGLVTVRINPKTGKRAKPGDRNAIFEIFRSGNLPSVAEAGIGSGESDSANNEALPEELF